ncbi:Por secretion system C-terminal sorting domain-containing protein [Lishizhenia tianjinensis]|uniref:Por secretion system C-terminal sorting domain-containing protein n=1 Tax=Lishizhenia tianjinensis TaxID=477690 RepID=A0A1I6Y7H0_9FLAO|nr:T9SS type A sorting domain-containing protein [Lishizhenia tianjinensis]SFT46436.1 Por secretion system C-terminal sorting domain-containing protein [Lishizhenia tianjinensis]
MKKNILLAALLLGTSYVGAQITQADEPAVGASINLYIIDSLAPEYENVTGNGVTWDYSTYGGYGASYARLLENVDPASTPNASTYASSTSAMSLQDGLTRFSNSTATEANSQGFVFNEVSFGEMRLVLDADEAQIASYPMNVSDQVIDSYAGTLYYSFNGIPTSSATIGTVSTTFDGEGTLMLAQGNTFNNVKRVTTIDTSVATIAAIGSTLELVRRQYDYYDYATSKLPIFSIVYFKIKMQGATNPLSESKVVLSSILPVGFVGVESVECPTGCETKVFPNPATSKLNVTVGEDAQVSIYSMTGELVTSRTVKKGMDAKFDVSEYSQGVYLVKIEGNTTRKVERVVIQ